MGDSEPNGAGASLRKILPWIGGVAAVLLGLWILSEAIEKMGGIKPGTMADKNAGNVTRADEALSSLAPHSAPAQLDVRVLDEKGEAYQVGSPLPRKLYLTMAGESGQEFQVPFDRVGVWAVDAPDGIYSVPGGQKGLGNWLWKFSGEGVKYDAVGKSWSVNIRKGSKPMTLRITLY